MSGADGLVKIPELRNGFSLRSRCWLFIALGFIFRPRVLIALLCNRFLPT